MFCFFCFQNKQNGFLKAKKNEIIDRFFLSAKSRLFFAFLTDIIIYKTIFVKQKNYFFDRMTKIIFLA